MSFARRETIIKWEREAARRHNNRPPYTSRLYISIATSTRFIEPATTTENQADSPQLLIVVLFKDFVSCSLFYFSNNYWFFSSFLNLKIYRSTVRLLFSFQNNLRDKDNIMTNQERSRTAKLARATILDTNRLHQLGVDMSTRRCREPFAEPLENFLLISTSPDVMPLGHTNRQFLHKPQTLLSELPSPPASGRSLASIRGNTYKRIGTQPQQLQLHQDPSWVHRKIPTPCNSCQRSDGSAERFHSHERSSLSHQHQILLNPSASVNRLYHPKQQEHEPSQFLDHLRIKFLRTRVNNIRVLKHTGGKGSGSINLMGDGIATSYSTSRPSSSSSSSIVSGYQYSTRTLERGSRSELSPLPLKLNENKAEESLYYHPRQPFLTCPICMRQFGSSSLRIHQPQCLLVIPILFFFLS